MAKYSKGYEESCRNTDKKKRTAYFEQVEEGQGTAERSGYQGSQAEHPPHPIPCCQDKDGTEDGTSYPGVGRRDGYGVKTKILKETIFMDFSWIHIFRYILTLVFKDLDRSDKYARILPTKARFG